MVIINIFQVTSDRSTINVSVETSTGETITSAKLWTDETFKNNALAIDLSSKLQGINNKEVFTVSSSDIGISSFDNIYFIEFTSTNVNDSTDDCNECNNLSLLGVTGNLGYFDSCLLNNILEIHYDTDDINNNILLNDVFNIKMLMTGIERSIKFGYYQNAIDILATLKVICRKRNECSQCGTLPDPVFKTHLNFGIIGNNLVLK